MTVTSTERLYKDRLSIGNKVSRRLWGLARILLFSWTPDYGFNGWRIMVLRLFGARIGHGCKIASDCRIWAPWNLRMGNYVCLAAGVDCYNVALIRLDDHVTISQRSYLCSASHDIRLLARPLTHAPIHIRQHAWVCAEAMIGPGVEIGEGSVAAARAVVMKSVPPWTVVGGNPAVTIKARVLAQSELLQ